MTAAAIAVVLITRVSIAAYFLATAAYALLVYLPFSYQQFILPAVAPALTRFAAAHHLLFWGVLAAMAASYGADLRAPASRVRTAILLAAAAGGGLWLSASPLLPRLRSDRGSLAVVFLSLAPVLWTAMLDLRLGRPITAPREDDGGDESRLLEAAAASALFVAATYFAIAALRAGGSTSAVAFVWSFAAHLVVFGALALALMTIRGAVRLAGGSRRHEMVLTLALATGCGAAVIAALVLAALSFTGLLATAVAVAFAVALVASVVGVAARLPGVSLMPRRGLPVLAAIAVSVWLLSERMAMIDWNYLLQKVSAIVVWLLSFTALYAMRRRAPGPLRLALVWVLCAAAAPAVAYRVLGTFQTDDIRGALDRHAGLDPSFKTIDDTLSAASTGDNRLFYDLLQRNTNLARDVAVEPVEITLVERLARSPAGAPHVFVFVVDSLRQDYLSPYNPAVAFTPAIAAFARDSDVFTRAFTRYGATGLSQPSIWAGGLLVHKQYVLPFAPMNALDKLLSAHAYQRFISRDTILRTIMPAGDADVDLDAGVQNMDYDLCRTLAELRGRVGGRTDRARPVFAYTQPQNIHVSRIARDGADVPGGGTFDGFYAPYASRVGQMDACFGAFVQFLRDEELYDDSVIVLTADHGDSLGEAGRWGHAYTIFPEILRIPLIVHLPRALRAQTTCDTDTVASLVDITPSLYYLLGHRPVASGGVFGRPLCTASPQERIATRRDAYMVASSYGPVYGILRGNARWLYIADGVNYTDYFYDLATDPAGAKNLVTTAVRREYQDLIRAEIDSLNRFYRPE